LKDFDDMPSDTRTKLLNPFIETKFLISEMVALQKKVTDRGLLKLKEPASGRKDRYSMLLYLSGVADILESQLKTTENTYDDDDDIVYVV